MTDILTDMKRNIAAAGDALMYSPPLRTEQAREMVVIVESLREDKRSLTRIVDDLSAQVNALNQMLAGMVEANAASTVHGVLIQLTRVKATPGVIEAQNAEPVQEMHKLASQGVVMAQNAELLDQLGDALAYINAGCVEVVDGRTVTVGNGIEVQGE